MTTRCFYMLLLAALLFIPSVHAAIIPLSEDWHLHSSAGLAADGGTLSQPGVDLSQWYALDEPCTVLSALVKAGVYADPYYGENMKGIPGYQDGMWLRHLEESPFRVSWWYRSEFELDAKGEDRHFTLHLDGINYQANIWLNGKKIAGEDTVVGMFRRFEFAVTEALLFGGKNALAVEIIPPGLLPEDHRKTKQLEATTGWDDHNPQPPDMNMGIWQAVYLREQGPVSMRHPYMESELSQPGLEEARLCASAWLRNNSHESQTCVFSAVVEGREISREVTLEAGEEREVLLRAEDFPQLVISSPRIWWPHPVGAQELYEVCCSVTVEGKESDGDSFHFGIRDISSHVNEDDWRGYTVNGRNILIRGGAWMTTDMLMNLDTSRYEALVRHAREANLNMLRSEGFSIRETKEFYDICDRYGVMVTQQLFGRNLPDEELAIACVEDTLLRIRNHPSLAHFLGHDETFPTDTLDAAYQHLLEKHRIKRGYQPHSGTFNIRTRSKTGGTRTGTRELWTYAGPSHYYFVKERPYDSAWGFAQSGGIGGILAARDSLRQMMPQSALWPLENNACWSFHTVTQGMEYFDAVVKALEKGYGPAENFEDFCRKLYAMNYNSARGMFEAYGRFKYDSLGITTWKYNAAWPAALTWQYVDWYTRPTAAYFGAKKACTPVHALLDPHEGAFHVVNSLYEAQQDLSLETSIIDLEGNTLSEENFALSVDADGVALAGKLQVPAEITNPYFVKLRLQDKEEGLLSENSYWLSTTPDIPGTSRHVDDMFYTSPESRADFTALSALPETEVDTVLSVVPGGYEIVIHNDSPHIAFQVELALLPFDGDFELAPVYWSDNFITLFPGESRKLQAQLSTEETPPVRLRVQGFNVKLRLDK